MKREARVKVVSSASLVYRGHWSQGGALNFERRRNTRLQPIILAHTQEQTAFIQFALLLGRTLYIYKAFNSSH